MNEILRRYSQEADVRGLREGDDWHIVDGTLPDSGEELNYIVFHSNLALIAALAGGFVVDIVNRPSIKLVDGKIVDLEGNQIPLDLGMFCFENFSINLN